MRENLNVPVEYVRVIAEELARRGADVDAWLQNSKLTRVELDDAERALPQRTFRKLVSEALLLAREPALGLFVGKRLVASTHGMVGAAAVNSRTVRQAMDIVERFSLLRSSIITIALEEERGRVVFTEAVPLGDVQRPILEAMVLSIRNVVDEITMGTCPILDVCFPFEEPEYAALARDMLRADVRWNEEWAGFSAPREALELPLKLADDGAFEEAARICQRELERIAAQESLSARVRRHLLEQQTGFPSLQVIARLLHMTPRTLHRRLIDEGTSYREILESVRHTLAVEHVKSARLGMAEIAYHLGYTDLANFRRAFRRWEGVPPSEYVARKKGRRKR